MNMTSNSPKPSDVRDAISSSVDLRTGVATIKPLQDEERETSHDPDIITEPERKSHGPFIKTKRDRETGVLTTFATTIHEGEDGYGITTIEQSCKGTRERDGLDRYSIVDDLGDDGIKTRLHVPVYAVHATGDADHNHENVVTSEPFFGADDNDAHQEAIQTFRGATDVTARKVTHSRLGRRTKDITPKLTEEELMKNYLNTYQSLLPYLKEPLEGQRFARLSHIFLDGRTFGFASALIKEGDRTFGILSVIWQTRKKPRRAVCVSFYKHGTTNVLTELCTCCPLRRQRISEEVSCCHARVCFETEELISSVKDVLNTRYEGDDRTGVEFPYFGECIKVDDCDAPRTVRLALKRTRQSHAYGRRWKFEIVFDVEQRLFPPVLKVQKRATRCLLCRGNPERRIRCLHEEACRGGRNRSEVDPQQQSGENETSDYSDWDSDETPEDRSFHGNRSVRLDADETEEYSPLSYKRSLLPCKGQVRDMESLVHQLEVTKNINFHEQNFIDCNVCGKENVCEPLESHKRQVRLFTLTQGAIDTNVYDWYCTTCEKMKRYTGKMDGIYPAGKSYCYSTEFMYFWLNQVCLQGLSFRSTFKTSNLLLNSPGLKYRNLKLPNLGSNRWMLISA